MCGSSDEPFPLAPGRSGPELSSALGQLESFVDACPVLQSNLRLVGEGVWPMEKFIRGPLWLPFQEPAFLRHGLGH